MHIFQKAFGANPARLKLKYDGVYYAANKTI